MKGKELGVVWRGMKSVMMRGHDVTWPYLNEVNEDQIFTLRELKGRRFLAPRAVIRIITRLFMF